MRAWDPRRGDPGRPAWAHSDWSRVRRGTSSSRRGRNASVTSRSAHLARFTIPFSGCLARRMLGGHADRVQPGVRESSMQPRSTRQVVQGSARTRRGEWRWFGPGEEPDEVRAADVVFRAGNQHEMSVAISCGQFLRSETRPYARWNHVMLVLDDAGKTAHATGEGLVAGELSALRDKRYVLLQFDCSDDDRAQVVAFAEYMLAEHHAWGWEIAASQLFSLLTGSRVVFGKLGTITCSGLCGRGTLAHGGDLRSPGGADVAGRPREGVRTSRRRSAFGTFPPALQARVSGAEARAVSPHAAAAPDGRDPIPCWPARSSFTGRLPRHRLAWTGRHRAGRAAAMSGRRATFVASAMVLACSPPWCSSATLPSEHGACRSSAMVDRRRLGRSSPPASSPDDASRRADFGRSCSWPATHGCWRRCGSQARTGGVHHRHARRVAVGRRSRASRARVPDRAADGAT